MLQLGTTQEGVWMAKQPDRDPGGKFLPGNAFRIPKGKSGNPAGKPKLYRMPSEIARALLSTPLSPAVKQRLGYAPSSQVTFGEAMLERAGFEALVGKSGVSIARLDQFLRILEPIKHEINATVEERLSVPALANRLDRLFAQRGEAPPTIGPEPHRTNGSGNGAG